ncbi:MAG TPA: class I SAM-dependent methyltransferase [Planctomycetaceae bacterium]|jgi:hypothetical protein
MSIILLQSCDEAYAPMLDATAATNAAYARAHGYAYRKIVGNLSPVPQTGNFNRYYLLREETAMGQHDWALWLDADAIVIDHSLPLESIIQRTPHKLIIACRGTLLGEHDINNGVFLLNLRHRLASELLADVIRYCEALDPRNTSFHSDQRVVQHWLLAQSDDRGRIEVAQCYTGREANLFNYNGPFVRHVLRRQGSFGQRLDVLQRLAGEVTSHGGRTLSPIGSSCGSPRTDGRHSRDVPLSFQQVSGILVASSATGHYPPGSVSWLLESSRRYGIDLTLLGQGREYVNQRCRIGMVAEYLREHPEYRYVLLVDFHDVIFCATLREIFYKYRAFGHEIVISAQRHNGSLSALGLRSSEIGTSSRFVNSGSIFATASAWIAAWESMLERERQLAGRPPQTVDGRHIFNDDQAAWADLHVNGEADIALDGHCRLFLTLDQIDPNIGTANRDLIFEGRRVVNRHTGCRPCLIHGAGDVPLTAWANYILDPAVAWNWPLVDRIRQAAQHALLDRGRVEQLLLDLGMHARTEPKLPDHLLEFTGKGLSVWQWPNQFAPYLTWLAKQPPLRSYLEIGVNEGGSFITTVEFLRRFHPLTVAIGVDPRVSPPVRDYVGRTAGISFVQGNRSSPELARRVTEEMRIGLVFIDGEHSGASVRADWEFARRFARYVAFHDIATDSFPDVGSLWREIRATYRTTCEFVEQYDVPLSCGGIGVVDLAGGLA